MPVSARFGVFPGSNCQLLCFVALVPEVWLTAGTNRRPSAHRSWTGLADSAPWGFRGNFCRKLTDGLHTGTPRSSERLFDFMFLSAKTTCWELREVNVGKGQRVKKRTSNHDQSSATTNRECLHGYFVLTQVFIQRPSRHSWASEAAVIQST